MSEERPGRDTESDDRPYTAGEPRTCAHCGNDVTVEEWHPVATRIDDDGAFRIYAFCDETCHDAWTEP